jgi:hypothetical protein
MTLAGGDLSTNEQPPAGSLPATGDETMSTETPTILESAKSTVAFELAARSAVDVEYCTVTWPELATAAVGKRWEATCSSNYCSEDHEATVVYRTRKTVVVLFEWGQYTDRGKKTTAELKAFSL